MSDSTSPRLAPSPQQRRAAETSPGLVGCAYEATGAWRASDVRTALERLATAHEILRTRLTGTGDDLAQVVDATASVSVEEGSGDDPRAALRAFVARAADRDTILSCALVTGASRTLVLLAAPATHLDPAGLDVLATALASTLAGDAPELLRDEDGQELQYGDLAAMQLDLLEDEDAPPARARFEGLGLAETAELRFGLERPLGEDQSRGEHVRTLSAEESAALHAASARADCSRAAVAFAAWALTAARQLDTERPALALRCEGRDFEGLDIALGTFERAVPLRLGATADEGFDAFAVRAQAELEQALEDQDAWDPNAAGETGPSSVFAWRGPFEEERGGRGLRAVARTGSTDAHRLALAFEATAGDGGAEVLSIRATWDARRLDGEGVDALLDQLVTRIVAAGTDGTSPARALSGASADWRASRVGGSTRDDRELRGIAARFAAVAQAHPDAIAVRHDDARRTYAELDQRTDRIARLLRDEGIRPGQFVGLYFERGPQMIEALLGVLKAGAAYLPLPPAYPDDRLAFMLADSGAPLVLTSTKRSGELVASQAETLILDQQEEALAALPTGPPDALHGQDDPAYVIYTSGSTGKPKGVPVSHGNLDHSTLAREEYYREAVGNYLLLSSFAFDSSVPGIFWTLTSGGTLVLPPEGAERELGQLPELVRAHGVTHLLALPSVYSLLLESGGDALASLRCVIVAGESAAPELVARHASLLPDCALFDEYGPTENTVWSSVQRCRPDDRFHTVPIGHAVPGVRVRIAEPDTAPPRVAAAGEAGELLVAGPQLVSGYLQRPELTAERFLADADGTRWYRTGDLARMHPDGTLEFLGRLDHQVKLRGYRIELEEIEAVLADRADVEEAVVTAPDFASDPAARDRRLVAYVRGTAQGADALRQHLAARLPDYMVPAYFVVLDELPRLPNGKVDRKALPMPDTGTAESTGATSASAAGSALERLIAHSWAELLELDTIGLDDDFFDLGGHSLLAARFFAQLNETLQIEAPLRHLFDNPSVRGLARALSDDPDAGERTARAAELAVQVLGLDGDAAAAAAGSGSALERLVATLWADGLGVDTVDVEEDFFDLGGHSLLAARLFAQMNELLQIEAPLRLLFDNPTVSGLCRALAGDDPAEAARLERTAELTLQVLEGE